MVGMTTHTPRHMYGTLLGGYKDVMVQEFAAMSSNHSRETQQRTYVNPDLNTLKRVSADLLYSRTVLPTASGSGAGKRQPVLTDRAEKRIQEGIAATSAQRLESYLKVRILKLLWLKSTLLDLNGLGVVIMLDRLLCRPCFCWRFRGALNRVSLDASRITLEKLECSKQAVTPEYSCME